MKFFADVDVLREPGVSQFALEGWIDNSPFEVLIGLQIEKAEKGQAHLVLPFTLKLANGGGVMHGGAMTTLADTAVAMAIKSLVPEGTVFATTELTVNFFAPVLKGQVAAHARVQGPEGRTFYGECDLLGEAGEVYAKLTSVFKVARDQG